MLAHLTLRRSTPPELRHSHGAHTHLKGVLQQLGRCALSRTRGWHLLRRGGKQIAEITLHTFGIEHLKLTEYHCLELCRALLTLRLKLLYFGL